MKKILIYLFSGTYFFERKFSDIMFILAAYPNKIILPKVCSIFPIFKRNLRKKGITAEQHMENTLNLCWKLNRNDVGGFSKRSVERYLTYLLFLFFAEAVCILKRLLNIDILNKLIHDYTLAVLIVCTLLASFFVTKIENFVLKGKRLTSLDRKPKDFRHKALIVFFVSCFIVIFVFFKLWLWPGIVHHLK